MIDTVRREETWQAFSKKQTWDLSKINTEIHVYVKFRAFDVVSSCFNDKIIHDDIPPQLKLKRHPKPESNQNSDYFILDATDNLSGVSTYYCSDLSDYNECDPDNVILNNLGEGLNSFTYFAIDKANNISEPLEYQWLVDLTPPEMRWIKTPNPIVRTNEIHFEFAATDTHTADLLFECHLNNRANPTPCTSPYVISGAAKWTINSRCYNLRSFRKYSSYKSFMDCGLYSTYPTDH